MFSHLCKQSNDAFEQLDQHIKKKSWTNLVHGKNGIEHQ
jgi:hypothetical protein